MTLRKEIEPEISMHEDVSQMVTVYMIKIPRVWLVKTKHPKLRISWWILKMIWKIRR